MARPVGAGTERLIIGRIARPHGVRGEVKVRPETDFPERFARLRRVLILAGDAPPAAVVVEGVRWQRGQVLLKLADVDDLEAARRLTGAAVAVPWADRVPLPQGSYYLAEILGLRVRTTGGEALGTVAEVLRTGSNDVYRVVGAGEVLVPATRDVVRHVDLERGEMVVDLPEGLR